MLLHSMPIIPNPSSSLPFLRLSMVSLVYADTRSSPCWVSPLGSVFIFAFRKHNLTAQLFPRISLFPILSFLATWRIAILVTAVLSPGPRDVKSDAQISWRSVAIEYSPRKLALTFLTIPVYLYYQITTLLGIYHLF